MIVNTRKFNANPRACQIPLCIGVSICPNKNDVLRRYVLTWTYRQRNFASLSSFLRFWNQQTVRFSNRFVLISFMSHEFASVVDMIYLVYCTEDHITYMLGGKTADFARWVKDFEYRASDIAVKPRCMKEACSCPWNVTFSRLLCRSGTSVYETCYRMVDSISELSEQCTNVSHIRGHNQYPMAPVHSHSLTCDVMRFHSQYLFDVTDFGMIGPSAVNPEREIVHFLPTEIQNKQTAGTKNMHA